MSQAAEIQPTEYKNERVHAVVIPKGACRIELRVKTTAELIDRARHEALKSVGKEVVLPGFRKGKAPEGMIQKKFPQQVEKELHNKLADVVFIEAQKIAKTPLLNNNSSVTFDLKHLDQHGAELVFSFETEPAVPSVDPKKFERKEALRPEVGDLQIDEAIRQMQYYFAEWIPITDRPIQEKDTLVIDLDTIEGETAQRVFNQVRFEVSKDRMSEWMQKLVIGARMGDLLEGVSEPDANASEEDKVQFTPKKVRVFIVAVQEALLPELNDEFAKKVGATDVANMRQSIADMLNKQADDKARDLLREQVNEFLVAEYPFEIPLSLVKTEKEHRFRQLNQNPSFRKDWNKMSPADRKIFEEKMIGEAADAVRLFYLSRQVVNDAKIGISRQEVQREAVAAMRGPAHNEVALDQIPKEVFAMAFSKVMLAKAQDFILMEKA